MSEIVRRESPAEFIKANAVIYFSGNIEAAKRAAPEGLRIRFCNAKYWRGDIESAGTAKAHGAPDRSIMFSSVFIAAGCQHAEDIVAKYEAIGIEVVSLEQPVKSSPPAPVASVSKTPQDLGWTLATAPADYLKKYPEGSQVKLARKILKQTGDA